MGHGAQHRRRQPERELQRCHAGGPGKPGQRDLPLRPGRRGYRGIPCQRERLGGIRPTVSRFSPHGVACPLVATAVAYRSILS